MSPGAKEADPLSRSSKKFDANTRQAFLDHGIYCQSEEAPLNSTEITDMLEKRRASFSESEFNDESFKLFRRANVDADTEEAVKDHVMPIIRGKAKFFFAQDVLFGGLEKLLDGATYTGPLKAKPDFCEGVRLSEIDLRIRQKLKGYIVPSPNAPALPNLFYEYKSSDGSPQVATLQACHDGALGARGVWKLQTDGESTPIFDHKAYTITSTYCAGALMMYSVHLKKSDRFGVEYHHYPIAGYAMFGAKGQFAQGVRAFRNARDWADKQRRQVLKDAHARLAAENEGAGRTQSPSPAPPPPPSSRQTGASSSAS